MTAREMQEGFARALEEAYREGHEAGYRMATDAWETPEALTFTYKRQEYADAAWLASLARRAAKP